MTLQTGSRAAVLRRSEPTRFSVGERRQRRRPPGAIRAERAQRVEQSPTGHFDNRSVEERPYARSNHGPDQLTE
jgi:hypothetical protein